MTQNYLPKLQKTLEALSVQVIVTDREGNSLIPDNDACYPLPELPERGITVYSDGKMYMASRSIPWMVLLASCPDDEASRNVFILADALIGAMADASAVVNDVNNAYQKLLQNELVLSELDAVVDEYRVKRIADRCVLLMHMVQVQKSNTYEILNEYMPRDDGDVMVSIDRHTAALIKTVQPDEEIEDLKQFACALNETVMNETGLIVSVGIGNIIKDVSELHNSYRQARRALEIGRVFRPDEHVLIYYSLMLERFLSTLSSETAMHYHGLLFNQENSRLFSDEMLQTIEMFFKKDLNLSDTARQLYIHRNTLVYRLDKVQRQTGLDLRRFDDAVTFKMLFDMEKCRNNQ